MVDVPDIDSLWAAYSPVAANMRQLKGVSELAPLLLVASQVAAVSQAIVVADVAVADEFQRIMQIIQNSGALLGLTTEWSAAKNHFEAYAILRSALVAADRLNDDNLLLSRVELSVAVSSLQQILDQIVREHDDLLSEWRSEWSDLTGQTVEELLDVVVARPLVRSDLTSMATEHEASKGKPKKNKQKKKKKMKKKK
jgi:hypothetical protein